MLAVFGLGNPGRRYKGTRHNVGFAVVDKLAEAAGVAVSRRRFQARIAEVPPGVLAGEHKVLLVKPQTFMNESGRSVQAVVAWNRLGTEDILVVSDDLDLDVGRIRVRRKGSSGGHKGLASIVRALGTTEFPRLRIGIGRPASGDPVDYVLDRFSRPERRVVAEAIETAADAVTCWARDGIEACMNRFN